MLLDLKFWWDAFIAEEWLFGSRVCLEDGSVSSADLSDGLLASAFLDSEELAMSEMADGESAEPELSLENVGSASIDTVDLEAC